MNIIKLKSKDTENIKRYLLSRRIEHTITSTTNTDIIKTKDTKYIFSDRFLSKKDLGFIGQVKKYAESLDIPHTKTDSSDIGYFKFYTNNEFLIKDCVEVDVNKAYWQIAYNEGFINKDIFVKGISVDKMTRLIALGSMASTKINRSFDGEKYGKIERVCNEVTRSYFFYIAKKLDDIMKEVCHGIEDSVFLYWVDAFIVKKDVAEYIHRKITETGLSVKSSYLPVIRLDKDEKGNKVCTVMEVKKRKENLSNFRIKKFTLPNEKRKKSIILDTIKKINNRKYKKNE